MVNVLRIGLMNVLGNLKATKGVDDIAALLRSAYDTNELHQGHFGRSIRAWQTANAPYRVL